MFIFQAIILGVIEGFTEFLPISSTGHLILAEQFIGFKDAAEIFTVVIQIGAIAGVIWFYKDDLLVRIKKFFKGDKIQQKFLINLVIATIPAAIIGLIFDTKLQTWAIPRTVALALIGGGIIMILVEKYHRGPRQVAEMRIDNITPKQALGVGVAQVVSLIPGVSRSGSTIIGGLVSGLNRVTATAFSFYLAIPVMVLASGYKVVKNHSDISLIPGGGLSIIIGIISSFIIALITVKWLLKYVSNHNFNEFAKYRIILGCFILIFLAVGLI